MDRIFVQIASYRDLECQHTIADLFQKASYPERIVVGVCWQYDPAADSACFERVTRPAQVRILAYHWQESRGVCWARNQAQRLYQGEEYVLSIDSHTRFALGWDERLIEELDQCPSVKAVLSNHPGSYTPPNDIRPNTLPTIMHANPFGIDGEIRVGSVVLSRRPPSPLRGAFVAPGFMFSRGTIVTDVPYDPFLYFNQEELSMSVRLFTHGYDVYSPTDVMLYHYYADVTVPNSPHTFHWNDEADWLTYHSLGAKRLNHLLGYDETDDALVQRELLTYGLGKERTLKEFSDFTGIDFPNHVVSERALRARFIEGLAEYLDGVIAAPSLEQAKTAAISITTYPERVLRPVSSGFQSSICSPEATIVKNTPPGILVVENYLSRAHCDMIKSYADAQTYEALKVEDFGVSWLDPARITHHVAIDSMSFEILSIFNDIYCNRVAPFFNADFDFYERPQILRYPPGGKYDAHSDAENWKADENAWRRSVDRDYSVILYLNDDYEGGQIRMVQQDFTLQPKPGMLLAFPSDHNFTHAVLPTTSGIRYAIVSWAAIVDSPRVREAAPYASVYLRQKKAVALAA